MNLGNITITDIINVNTVYSEKGKNHGVSDRRYYGLSLCTQGQITYIQNGCEYVSSAECAVILPKGGTYLVKRDKTGYFPVINFDCREFLCDNVTVIPIQNTEQLIADYEKIKKLFCFNGNHAKMFSIFYDMLHKLSADDIPYILKRAIQLINDNYSNANLTNERLACECNMSEVYFRKLFSRHFKTSPKQFIIDVRLQKAKQLLTEDVLNNSTIAEMCGFSNPYHFCRIFKQHMGKTPSEYKKDNLIY